MRNIIINSFNIYYSVNLHHDTLTKNCEIGRGLQRHRSPKAIYSAAWHKTASIVEHNEYALYYTHTRTYIQ